MYHFPVEGRKTLTSVSPSPSKSAMTIPGGRDCFSKAPISQKSPWGRETPRWSSEGQPLLMPASIAGLPDKSACVGVCPPLSASEPNRGSVFSRSPELVKVQLVSLLRLCPQELHAPEGMHWSPSLFATMLFLIYKLLVLSIPPPRPDGRR